MYVIYCWNDYIRFNKKHDKAILHNRDTGNQDVNAQNEEADFQNLEAENQVLQNQIVLEIERFSCTKKDAHLVVY